MRAVNLPKEAKPALMTKKREQAVVRLSGVKGDGVCRKNNRGTWETRQNERGETGRHNGTSFLGGVGEAHSSEEAG